MKYYFPFILFLSFVISSCTSYEIDLNNSQYYDISVLLESKNCKSKCMEMADCEGKFVKTYGIIDSDDLDQDKFQFFILDQFDEKTTLEINVDTLLAPAVFPKIIAGVGKRARVSGIMEGYDSSSNSSSCVRKFILNLDSEQNLDIVE